MHWVLDKDVVVVGAVRTPIGARDGILGKYSATDLGGIAVKAALARSGVPPDQVDEVILGLVVGAGLGMAPAKKASVAAGIPQSVPATIVNSVCSSGMTAVWNAVQSIALGTSELVVAGGMESRTNAPYLVGPHTSDGKRLKGELRGREFLLSTAHAGGEPRNCTEFARMLQDAGIRDANVLDGLSCPFKDGLVQNDYAVAYAKQHGYSIEKIDACAYESYRKADEAWETGKFDDEVVPVGDATRDELTPRSRWENLRGKSTSASSGYNTAGLGDAAAALVLTTARRAGKLGVRPLVRVMGLARFECGPAEFIEAPVHAADELKAALRKAGLAADFPIVEANESFGLQLILFHEAWPESVINVHGGTVALRHPLGAAGARILTTLIHAMRRYGHARGLGTICFGGGGAFAAALELVKD
jgi:acetyl-CoA C-acetyltransferase